MNKAANEFEIWARQGDLHSYYFSQPRFFNAFSDVSIESTEDYGTCLGWYKNYVIFKLNITGKSIAFVDFSKEIYQKSDIAGSKLLREYWYSFGLQSQNKGLSEYVITQHNELAVIEYIDTVKRKIDNGFEKYNSLVEKQQISPYNAAFLRIDLNNVFSITDLNELLSAYNDLYKLLYYASVNSSECITEADYSHIQESPNMVVDSIHMASPGILMALGEALVVELLKDAVLAFLNNEPRIAAEKRREIEQKAQNDLRIKNNSQIIELIDQLDSVLARKANGGNPATQYYLEQQAKALMEKIDRLQGTTHLNLVV